MAAQLEIQERLVGSVAVLRLKGRLVADEEDFLFTCHVDGLVAAGILNIVVNFADVASLDSGGVGTLVAKYLSVKRRGGDVRLVGLTDRTRRVLEITRLIDVFATYTSEEAAIASFSSVAAIA